MRKPADQAKVLDELKKEFRDLRHINEFVRLSCAGDLLNLRLFPDAKEITESMAAFEAIRKYCDFSMADENVLCVCVADGSTPRTAALIAHMTKWMVRSVDPALKDVEKFESKIKRLLCYPRIVEKMPEFEVDHVVIVAVHAHNYEKRPEKGEVKPSILIETIKKVKAKEYLVVALPCCHDLKIPGQNFIAEYNDVGIWSDKNTVRVWSFGGN